MKLLAFLAGYWWDFALVIALAVATWMQSNFLSRKRTSVLAAVASRLGFAFGAEDWSHGNRAPQLETPLFEKGTDTEFHNILSGTRAGLESSFFDYSFRRGRNVTRQTLATFSQDAWLPLFELVPRSFLRKLGDTILTKDVHIESHPDFSRKYQLRSPEEEKVRAVFTSGLLSYVAGLDLNRRWHVEGCGLTLVIFHPGKIVKPEDFKRFIEETTAFAKAFFVLSGLKTFRT